MRAAIKRIVLLVVGWGFILLGIVGLFLPVLQGILFIVIGLIILSSEYVWAHHLLEKLKKRFPGVARKSHEATARARAWIGRLGRRSPSSQTRPPGSV
ncbi:MAG: PGPGW domain-containing protein [Acidobacteria bacterium]|nr:PGPGW domain-containing protein [Acidobacteriota bacterium]